MGDPAGVGPEVIAGAWINAEIHERVSPLVVGHPEIMRRAARLLDCQLEVVVIASPDWLREKRTSPQIMPCLATGDDEALRAPIGAVSPHAGEAAYRAVRIAAELALEKKVDGIVTAPLSKAALHAAGHHYPGHTELLAEICGVADFAMMLYLSQVARNLRPGSTTQSALNTPYSVHSTRTHTGDDANLPHAASSHGFGVVHVTLHQSLRSVFDDITSEAITAKCRLAHSVMRRLGVARPRVAVCALNPHAGEEGLFGDEERTIIAPGVVAAQHEGLNVSGPYPTDTLMVRARNGEFDAVVAMYHDQGHIALKLLGMHAAVNITLGLPIVRTSVAHGTAFDRAWQGTARLEGMLAAINTAAQLALTPAPN
jgi:4-phospho-D-threonate 3-dehydrogenase / 4-phospho-D-erythronate 3-dehydrogenase